MKLTEEQVEIQRKKFEFWYLPEKGWHGCFDSYPINKTYIYKDVQDSFEGWLACSESMEIEIPSDPKNTFAVNGYERDVIESLIAQGFTIKNLI